VINLARRLEGFAPLEGDHGFARARSEEPVASRIAKPFTDLRLIQVCSSAAAALVQTTVRRAGRKRGDDFAIVVDDDNLVARHEIRTAAPFTLPAPGQSFCR
jgi:hypothetical protein